MEQIKGLRSAVTIGLVGKYVQLHDAYLSVAEALRHAGYPLGAKIHIRWIDSETVTEDNYTQVLGDLDGILVPGGFGARGIEGMIWPPGMPGSARSPIWASAWECRWRSSNLPAMWPG